MDDGHKRNRKHRSDNEYWVPREWQQKAKRESEFLNLAGHAKKNKNLKNARLPARSDSQRRAM